MFIVPIYKGTPFETSIKLTLLLMFRAAFYEDMSLLLGLSWTWDISAANLQSIYETRTFVSDIFRTRCYVTTLNSLIVMRILEPWFIYVFTQADWTNLRRLATSLDEFYSNYNHNFLLEKTNLK